MKNARQQAGALSLLWGLKVWGRKLAMLQLREGSGMDAGDAERRLGGWSGSRGVTFLLHPYQACGAEMNVRGLLMRPRGVKHSLLLRAE